MEKFMSKTKLYLRQNGLETQPSILDSTEKMKKEFSEGLDLALIQIHEEMKILKTLNESNIQSFLTLEGLTVSGDFGRNWYGDQGVSIFGDYGENLKYNRTQTPLIYGDLYISDSEISWKIDPNENSVHDNYYMKDYMDNLEFHEWKNNYKEHEKHVNSIIALYYEWVESLKPELFKILKELGVTKISM